MSRRDSAPKRMTSRHANQLYNRSLDFCTGHRVAKDEVRAFALNAEAAAEGHGDAVLAMGWYYLNGVGVERDVQKARDWYRHSARRGEPMAMFSLGVIAYDEGDWAGALVWFRRAANTGHHRSLYFLAKLHWKGRGVERNASEAKRLLHTAADRNVKEARRVLRFLSRRKRERLSTIKRVS